ncbi:MAG: DMT family transporter [Deltaproteobacteria bacterium]|nr:DMT family transporter [Deltaproteobacteria bacterium]MCW8892211.1 DMT family transporter [Deltaproteobacteria bacterium]
MTRYFHGLSSLYLAVFLLSLNGLFAKLIPLDATSITQLRSLIAVGAFLLFCRFRRRPLRLQCVNQFLGVYALGILLGLHWATFFHAMQVSTVAVGMLSLFSFPIITILLEPFFIKEKLKLKDFSAGLIVLLGVAVMVSSSVTDIRGSVFQGVFWGVMSAILFSLRNLIQKYHYSSVPSDRLMFHQVIAVSLMLLPFIDISKISLMSSTNWTVLLMLGVLSTATAHTLLTYSLKQLPAKSVALIGCSQPLIASILAWLVMQEIPQLSVAIGGGIILSVAIYESLQKR